ncbi:MAG: adenosylcobinamide-GDP ribazoletransferase [Emcibacter sp.]|nr:adenosylcobinamide-GDP ribazoletransferase [Emcibacter sp.]
MISAATIIRDIAAAMMVLTRIPVPWDRLSDHPPNITKSLWAYPLVGFLLSAVGAAVYGLASLLLLPPSIAALLTLISLILITGALHEDGLADMADGFGGGRDKEYKLKIMRDSRIGTYGGACPLALPWAAAFGPCRHDVERGRYRPADQRQPQPSDDCIIPQISAPCPTGWVGGRNRKTHP